MFLLHLLSTAGSSIYLQTPNITSPAIMPYLKHALSHGIDIHIVTSEGVQVLEQIVTAGTTTGRYINKLIKAHKKLLKAYKPPSLDSLNRTSVSVDPSSIDLEAGSAVPLNKRSRMFPGNLKIEYYKPRSGNEGVAGEPVQSHFKCTIVDGEKIVLGSGNMDRASWYTSQELGVAFFGKGVVREIKEIVESGLVGRTKVVYEG